MRMIDKEQDKVFNITYRPIRWTKELENSIELDNIASNLFDLKVFESNEPLADSCATNNTFTFKVGTEEIFFSVVQRVDVIETVVDGHVCTNLTAIPIYDHFLEIFDSKNNIKRRYSLEMIEEVIPEEIKDYAPEFMDTHIKGNINIKTEPEYAEPEDIDPFDLPF